MARESRVALVLMVVSALGWACSSTAPKPALPNAASLHHGPLTDYVPEAGLRWMLVGSPMALASDKSLFEQVRQIIPQARLDSFEASSGIRLQALSEACIAGFDYGTVYLARVGNGTAVVRKSFEARLVTEPIVRSERPNLWRIGGMVANTPESLLVVEDDFVALAVGDPLLARIVEGFAIGRFKKTMPALQGSALATLASNFDSAPLRFYVPGPFFGSWAKAASGVLAQAFSLAIVVDLPHPGYLRLRLIMPGAFGPDIAGARQRVVATWEQLQSSPVGRVLRLQEFAAPATVEVTANRVALEVTYASSVIIEGLGAATVQGVSQLLNLPAHAPATDGK